MLGGSLLTKPSNVEDSNVSERRLKREALIDLANNVIKQLDVKCFGQCVSGSTSLLWLQRHSVKIRSKTKYLLLVSNQTQLQVISIKELWDTILQLF